MADGSEPDIQFTDGEELRRLWPRIRPVTRGGVEGRGSGGEGGAGGGGEVGEGGEEGDGMEGMEGMEEMKEMAATAIPRTIRKIQKEVTRTERVALVKNRRIQYPYPTLMKRIRRTQDHAPTHVAVTLSKTAIVNVSFACSNIATPDHQI